MTGHDNWRELHDVFGPRPAADLWLAVLVLVALVVVCGTGEWLMGVR